MNLFECTLIGGGAGANLVVTCDPNFAGTTITCTDGTKTYRQTCPSASPYTVTFKSIPVGVWTISGIAAGQTFTTSVTITDFETELHLTPDGATVTPTDVIATWLHCANIWDKSYTTLSEVLNDGTTVTALIASSNAVDYMARSTTWASDVCADSSAMTKIGANDYCAEKLLDNSTWRTAICNSTYFESVLNVKVPAMTSETTPSGEVSCSPTFANDYKFFDGSWYLTGGYQFTADPILSYAFPAPVKIYKVGFAGYGVNTADQYYLAMTAEVYGDDTKLLDISITQSKHRKAFRNFIYFIMNPSAEYETYRFKIVGSNYNYISARAIGGLQFYGRA